MKCTNLDISKPLKLVGGKWKIAIIYVLSKGPIRFGHKKNTYPNNPTNAY